MLKAAPLDDGFQVEADAAGYLPEECSLPGDDLKGPKFAVLTLEMYSGPAPSVELVVPVGYRGLVRVETRIRDDLPCPPGQRCFRYDVPASGVVQVCGPALFRRVPAIHARWADGTPLAADAPDLDVGFRWVKSENGCELYLVGTRVECDTLRRAPDAAGKSSDGDRPRGSGRHGRRGSQTPADGGDSSGGPDSP